MKHHAYKINQILQEETILDQSSKIWIKKTILIIAKKIEINIVLL